MKKTTPLFLLVVLPFLLLANTTFGAGWIGPTLIGQTYYVSDDIFRVEPLSVLTNPDGCGSATYIDIQLINLDGTVSTNGDRMSIAMEVAQAEGLTVYFYVSGCTPGTNAYPVAIRATKE